MEYKVLSLIWHTGEERYCSPGAVVSLDHLDDAGIAKLVSRGIVEPVSEAKSAKPPASKSFDTGKKTEE